MNRDEIFEKIQDVLDDALGVDEDEVTPESSLTADLGAESIDFLDIVFRIEKTFDFKISQGELFPENLTENEEWVADGKLTDSGLEMLRNRMTHVDFDAYAERYGGQNATRSGHSVKSDRNRRLSPQSRLADHPAGGGADADATFDFRQGNIWFQFHYQRREDLCGREDARFQALE